VWVKPKGEKTGLRAVENMGKDDVKHIIQDIFVNLLQKVVLTFDSFQIEAPYLGSSCYDNVAIYDGCTAVKSAQIGVYCGTNTPSYILSIGSQLLITFDSDESISSQGFMATYSRKQASPLDGILSK